MQGNLSLAEDRKLLVCCQSHHLL